MPLFGHKNKHTTDAPITGTAASTGIGPGSATAPGVTRPYESTNLNTTNTVPGTGHHGGLAGESADRHHLPPQTGFNNTTQGQYGNEGYGTGTQGFGHNQAPLHGTTVGGAGMGAGAGELPRAHMVNQSQQSHNSGGQGITGKVERTIGSLVGSTSLKEKGLQKEQEANAYKVQAAELAEAERLEREALMRRERAVGHGAHPDNKHLGGGTAHGGAGGF